MKALVLIGGLGTRLRPITYALPKQLIPLAGKPMLYHVLDLLPPGLEEVVLASGYMAEAIERCVRDDPPRLPIRTVAEATPLGTGGGMKNAGGTMSDPFLFMYSDVIAAADFSALLAAHHRSPRVGTMAIVEVENPQAYGVAALEAGDRISRFVEKPSPGTEPSRWINAGLAVWALSVLEKIPAEGPVSFEQQVVPTLLDDGVFGFRLTGFWDDAGTRQHLLRSQRFLFDAGRGASVRMPRGATGSGPVATMEGASADGASFGPYVTLGRGAHVEEGAHVEDSVIMDGARVGRGAHVLGSIVGPRTRIAPERRVVDALVSEAP